MAESSAQGGESLDALARRVERLNQKMDQAKSAAAGAKATSIVMTILIALAAIIGVGLLLQPLIAAYQDPEPYREALVAEVQERVLPAVQEEVRENSQRIFEDVAESARSAFAERQEELFVAVNDNIEDFVMEMTTFGETQLNRRRATIRNHIEETLVAEVPALQDPDRTEEILANAAASMENVVQRIMDDYLAAHLAHILNIEEQIRSFPIPDRYVGMDRDALTTELVDELGVYSLAIFRDTINPQTRATIQAVLEEE